MIYHKDVLCMSNILTIHIYMYGSYVTYINNVQNKQVLALLI